MARMKPEELKQWELHSGPQLLIDEIRALQQDVAQATKERDELFSWVQEFRQGKEYISQKSDIERLSADRVELMEALRDAYELLLWFKPMIGWLGAKNADDPLQCEYCGGTAPPHDKQNVSHGLGCAVLRIAPLVRHARAVIEQVERE